MTAEEELIKSIKKKLKSGYPDGELKNELLEKGHSEEEIEKLFYVASGHPNDKSDARTSKNNSASMFKLIGVALLITGITIMSADTWLKEYGIYVLVASGVCFVIGFAKAASRTEEK